jgi:hypothetical protein
MRIKRVLTAMVLALTVSCSKGALAQEPTSTKPAAPVTSPPRPYRFDFSLNEFEDGKKINTRQYSVDLNDDDQPGIAQIGTRVPVGLKSDGTPQYLDVNTRIMARLYVRSGVSEFDVNCDVTSVAPNDDTSSGRPVLRTLSISGGTVLQEGKPINLGIADDPNSKREFQLEVTISDMK